MRYEIEVKPASSGSAWVGVCILILLALAVRACCHH